MGKTGRQLQVIKVHRVVKGSLVWLKRVCGKAGCRCYRGKKHVSLYLSRSIKGKTTMTYIPHRYETAIEAAVGEYKMVLKALDKLSRINLTLIRQGKDI